MEQVKHFGDCRLVGWCVYCRGLPGTRDHVPSRVLLDEPYPENLPVVEACARCNAGFSLDEEYVACLVETALAGSPDSEIVTRPKIARLLREKPLLREQLRRARQDVGGRLAFVPDLVRVTNVMMKLARGHAAFELDEFRSPDSATVALDILPEMAPDAREDFEDPPDCSFFPEVGSRAMQRWRVVTVTLAADSDPSRTLESHLLLGPGWVNVQEGRYRYLATVLDSGQLEVRIVLSEYLACRVLWE